MLRNAVNTQIGQLFLHLSPELVRTSYIITMHSPIILYLLEKLNLAQNL